MKLALVHDHLAQDGGAEKVLRVMQEIYPQAPTFTLVHDKEQAYQGFLNKDIRTSFIQGLPGGIKHYQWFFPLMPWATETYDLRGYEVVLSSSSAFSKGVITRPETLHVCYCHTPTRYLWSDTHDYVRELKYGRVFKRFIPLILSNIRIWDRLTADRVDVFIANSDNVRKRIWKYYRRPSVVIHPPVNTSQFKISGALGDYFLTGGRLVYYKRFDIATKAFNELGLPLKIFGTGPELENLKKMAKNNIEFLGNISSQELTDKYSKCQAFIHPQEEDFGLTAVEAMASGRPVIAFGAGGALESVVEGITGQCFKNQNWQNLAYLVSKFNSADFDPVKIKEHSRKFDTLVYKSRIADFVSNAWQDFRNKPDTFADNY